VGCAGKLAALANTESINSAEAVTLQIEDLTPEPPLPVGGELVRDFDPPSTVTITTGMRGISWPFDWGVEPAESNIYKDTTTGNWIVVAPEGTTRVRIWWHGGNPDNPLDPATSGGNLMEIEKIEYFS